MARRSVKGKWPGEVAKGSGPRKAGDSLLAPTRDNHGDKGGHIPQAQFLPSEVDDNNVHETASGIGDMVRWLMMKMCYLPPLQEG